MNTAKYSILLTGPVILSCVLGRASFCLFLLSTIGTNIRVRILLWAALISQALVNISMIILQYANCGSHITAIWDTSIHAKCVGFDTMVKYLYFMGGLYPCSAVGFLTDYSSKAWNAFIDLFLTIVPAIMLKGLQMQFRKKVVVMILLCISGL